MTARFKPPVLFLLFCNNSTSLFSCFCLSIVSIPVLHPNGYALLFCEIEEARQSIKLKQQWCFFIPSNFFAELRTLVLLIYLARQKKSKHEHENGSSCLTFCKPG